MAKALTISLLTIIFATPLVLLIFYIDKQQRENETEIKEEIILDINNIQRERTEPEGYSLIERELEESCVDCESSIEYKEIKEEEDIKQIGWIPPWDYNNAVNSLKNFESSFHSTSPVTFQINADGSLKSRLDPNLNELKEIRKEKGIKIIPTISNFDWKLMKGIYDNPTNTQRHITEILKAVKAYDYDGIDLDYESLSIENKESFLKFVETLSTELKKDDKILSVTVLPKWGESVHYTSFAETRRVQDWKVLAGHADQIRIMAYDFTPASSSTDGPIAPIKWIERILDYAKETIPKEKTWLGIHLYGYEWVMPTRDAKETQVSTNAYTYDSVKSKVLSHSYVDSKYDETFQEGYATYTCLENSFCILYYATPESVQARKKMAHEYGIAGVSYWRLGGEGELIR